MQFGAGNYPRNVFLWGGCHPKQRNRSQLVPAPHQVSQGLRLCTRVWGRGLERLPWHPGLRLPMRKTSGGTTPYSSSGPIVNVPTGGRPVIQSPVCMYALCARKHAHPAQGQAEAEVRAYRKENLFLWFSGEKDHVNLSDSPL